MVILHHVEYSLLAFNCAASRLFPKLKHVVLRSVSTWGDVISRPATKWEDVVLRSVPKYDDVIFRFFFFFKTGRRNIKFFFFKNGRT